MNDLQDLQEYYKKRPSDAENIQKAETATLWNQLTGKNYYQGSNESLVRSLCWGNQSATLAMLSFIEVVRRLQDRVDSLEQELNERSAYEQNV